MTRRHLPEFLRESLVEETSDDGAVDDSALDLGLVALTAVFEPRSPSADIGQRLMASTEALPQRYAPFFDQLMQMFELDEPGLMRELSRAGNPAEWKASGLPGVRIFELVAGARLESAQTLLVQFAAGSRFPNHRHRSPERTLILEGGYADETGKEYLPGDYDDRGTEGIHSFRALADEPCIAASVHHGFDFEFWPLRLFQRLMGH